jgi:hypothetical protein
VLLLRWADPEKLGAAIPESLIGEFGKIGPVQPPDWPPVSIGNLPIGAQSLTMTDDEFEFVDPCGEEAEQTREEPPAERPHEEARPAGVPENLLELW